ncbi:hypothetical protein ACFX19_034385 [Malus domestica]
MSHFTKREVTPLFLWINEVDSLPDNRPREFRVLNDTSRCILELEEMCTGIVRQCLGMEIFWYFSFAHKKIQVHNQMWIRNNRMSQMPQDVRASLPIEFKNKSSPLMKVLDQGQDIDPSIVSNRHER